MIIEFEISDKSFEILKEIKKAKSAEFRDYQFESLEDFKKSDKFVKEGDGMCTEAWFKRRNFCDRKDLDDLFENGLIDDDGESWHITYVVTERGKKIIEKYSK
jgi:hypothetical protein